MSVLVLRHEPGEPLGHLETVLRERGEAFLCRDLGEPLSLEGHRGLVMMGGPMSANDPCPGLVGEMRLIQAAVDQDIPILGICLGSQLLAKTLGGRVHRNLEKEIGWFPVRCTDTAKTDPLFQDLPSPATFFHWHRETFDLPAGAEWLAYSERCRHQAFRFGERIYGIQFHPEVTPEIVRDWCAEPADRCDAETLASIDPYAFDPEPMARRIFERWLDLF